MGRAVLRDVFRILDSSSTWGAVAGVRDLPAGGAIKRAHGSTQFTVFK